MRVSVPAIVAALAGAAVASSSDLAPRNFIYIVPDGYGTASQVLARDFVSIRDGHGTVDRPSTQQLGADRLVRPFPISGPALRALWLTGSSSRSSAPSARNRPTA